jgi:hypothetical protein
VGGHDRGRSRQPPRSPPTKFPHIALTAERGELVVDVKADVQPGSSPVSTRPHSAQTRTILTIITLLSRQSQTARRREGSEVRRLALASAETPARYHRGDEPQTPTCEHAEAIRLPPKMANRGLLGDAGDGFTT